MESEMHEMDTTTEVKVEPCLVEGISTELKLETEETWGGEDHINSESGSFASVFIVQPGYEVETKSEAAAEPGCIIQTSAEQEFESEGVDLHFVTQAMQVVYKALEKCMAPNTLPTAVPVLPGVNGAKDVSREDQQFTLPESTRLSREAAVTIARLNKDCLNSSPRGKATRNTADDKKVHKCPFCDKRFSSKAYLRCHIVIHMGIRKHWCSICDRNFIRAAHLREHMLIHEGNYPYRCEKCDKRFTTASRLRSHNVVHEGKKIFKCKMCESSFLRATSLKSHSIVHSGIRAFKCDKCEKSYPRAAALKHHYLSHEGKRPYKCAVCEKTFTNTTYLKAHTLIHENKRSYKCSICERSFIQSSNLKAHTLIHGGKRPHKCGICGKGFIRSTHLKSHINVIHEGKQG